MRMGIICGAASEPAVMFALFYLVNKMSVLAKTFRTTEIFNSVHA